MKMPNTNSKPYKIIKLLLTGAQLTPEEGVLQHGTLRLTLAEISGLYRDLVVRGCAETVCEAGPRIRASDALLERFGLIEAPPDPSQQPKVPPRQMPPFKPLSRQNIPSSRGFRDGSNDLRDVPSHYGSCANPKEQA